MNYLKENEIQSILNRGIAIEYLIGYSEENNFRIITWMSIEQENQDYILYKHKVFDEGKEIDSIYDYSYVEPDEIYGLEVLRDENIENIILAMKNDYNCDIAKFFREGVLNELISNT